MKRLIDVHLRAWKENPLRQPLILRGARQVGKTHAVRELGKSYDSFVEINFETDKKVKNFFVSDLNPHRILREISTLTGQEIIPGKTLLFFDEAQAEPQAIIALRYFYEVMPELHVIVAGSLIDFVLHKIGVPVGRVQFLHMYPMSFIEFLSALGHVSLIERILTHPVDQEISEAIHDKILNLLGQYLALGGMPRVVACWQEKQNLNACSLFSRSLVEAYQIDFIKYGKSNQVKYLDKLFSHIPQQLGRKFKYSTVGEFRKRELDPCVDLLVTAGVVHRISHTDAHGIPLGAEVDFETFKLLLIDVAISQFMLDLKVGDWLLNPLEEYINKGALVEALVGQELTAYQSPMSKARLYYWKRDARGSEAELDYVIQLADHVVPVEVKSGKGKTLRSMSLFLDSHPKSTYGIRLSTQNYSVHNRIHSYPLYAIAKLFADVDPEGKKALMSLAMKKI